MLARSLVNEVINSTETMAKSTKIISISLRTETVAKLNKELPRYGDRSRLLQYLVDKFLEGKIIFNGVKRVKETIQ